MTSGSLTSPDRMPVVLALDIGATFLKGGVVGEVGVILAESTTETHAAEGP